MVRMFDHDDNKRTLWIAPWYPFTETSQQNHTNNKVLKKMQNGIRLRTHVKWPTFWNGHVGTPPWLFRTPNDTSEFHSTCKRIFEKLSSSGLCDNTQNSIVNDNGSPDVLKNIPINLILHQKCWQFTLHSLRTTRHCKNVFMNYRDREWQSVKNCHSQTQKLLTGTLILHNENDLLSEKTTCHTRQCLETRACFPHGRIAFDNAFQNFLFLMKQKSLVFEPQSWIDNLDDKCILHVFRKRFPVDLSSCLDRARASVRSRINAASTHINVRDWTQCLRCPIFLWWLMEKQAFNCTEANNHEKEQHLTNWCFGQWPCWCLGFLLSNCSRSIALIGSHRFFKQLHTKKNLQPNTLSIITRGLYSVVFWCITNSNFRWRWNDGNEQWNHQFYHQKTVAFGVVVQLDIVEHLVTHMRKKIIFQWFLRFLVNGTSTGNTHPSIETQDNCLESAPLSHVWADHLNKRQYFV